jgi:hypothetical protein
MLAFLHEKDQV